MTPHCFLAILQFTAWEGGGVRRQRPAGAAFRADRWLAILAIDMCIEASVAQALSFAHLNSPATYWAVAIALAIFGRWPGSEMARGGRTAAVMAALATPLLLLAFRPVDEIDSDQLPALPDRVDGESRDAVLVRDILRRILGTVVSAGLDGHARRPLLSRSWRLKGVALVALAAWAVGRELDVRPAVLAWTVFGAVTMRHYWLEHSGVATLKNDALHGAGFLLLTAGRGAGVAAAAGRRRHRAVRAGAGVSAP